MKKLISFAESRPQDLIYVLLPPPEINTQNFPLSICKKEWFRKNIPVFCNDGVSLEGALDSRKDYYDSLKRAQNLSTNIKIYDGFKDFLGDLTNRNAKYTKSNHYVTGFDYALGNASRISIEGFIKKYGNFPISIVDGVSLANKGADFEVLGNENVITNGKGKTQGIELLFQQKLTRNFYGIFSYTFFKSEFTDINGNYLPSVWDSKHLSSFSGGYKLKKNWEISSRWRFAGKTP